MKSTVPTYDQLFNPVLEAMRKLGGSATNQELEDQVIDIMNLTEGQINELHRGNRTKLNYRLAWTRNYLKRVGLLQNSSRGVWSLTKLGFDTQNVDEAEIIKTVKNMTGINIEVDEHISITENIQTLEVDWKAVLINKLLTMSPESFERLCQRILRESGFVEVQVTGRSGDGGIDGHGIIKLNNLISYPIIFQCKRYRGSVSSKELRDFRGAMAGRTDKGIFITTGTFTRDAQNEAKRDGVTNINLIDGDSLIELLKTLKLGITIDVVERISVDNNWFAEYN